MIKIEGFTIPETISFYLIHEVSIQLLEDSEKLRKMVGVIHREPLMSSMPIIITIPRKIKFNQYLESSFKTQSLRQYVSNLNSNTHIDALKLFEFYSRTEYYEAFYAQVYGYYADEICKLVISYVLEYCNKRVMLEDKPEIHVTSQGKVTVNIITDHFINLE